MAATATETLMAPSLQSVIAAHRFGLGEADLGIVGADPRAWLAAQIGPADAPRGMTAEQIIGGHYREVIVADARSRLATAALTRRPFAERLQWFWTNHFTVSLLKGSTRGLVGAFERDAIRPNIAGRFETLLVASTTHPAMLRYLDKRYPEGPDALRQVLHDLAQHPATARFVSTKLARHFVADEPPPALVERLAAIYLKSDGQLAEVYRELIRNDLSWNAGLAKLKTPEEFVVSTARVLGIGDRLFERQDGGNAAGT